MIHGFFNPGPHHQNLEALIEAAASDCKICKGLLQATTKAGKETLLASLPWTYYHFEPIPKDGLAQVCIGCQEDKNFTLNSITVSEYFLVAPRASIRMETTVADRGGLLSPSNATQTVRTWLRACSREHAQCTAPKQPSVYPTRLLELRKSSVRLVLTKQKAPRGPYAALSYCWGPPPHTFMRLTASTMEPLRAGVLDVQLPAAFQEAIKFTKSIGVRYLWIDSLCIIQEGPGSTEDWLYESTRMQDVYSNCLICLALYRSASPHESVFVAPPPDVLSPFIVKTDGVFDGDASSDHTSVVVPRHYFRNTLLHQPLGRRAWALQERLLSPRVVSFSVGEISWTCKELFHASETFPDGLAHLSAPMEGVLDIPWIPHTSETETRDLVVTWFRIVTEYTSRQLTYPESDKMIAISAIAARMGQAMNDDYVEGHFLKTMARSLYWSHSNCFIWGATWETTTRTKFSETDERQLIFHRPPTWSWASADKLVFFEPIRFDECRESTKRAEVLADAAIYSGGSKEEEMSSKNPTVLKLTGFLIGGTLKHERYDKLDEESKTFLSFHSKSLQSTSSIRGYTVLVDELHSISAQGSEAIFCPLYCANYDTHFQLRDDCIRGIFIMKTDRAEGGHAIFERVGCGMTLLQPGNTWIELVKELKLKRTTVLLA